MITTPRLLRYSLLASLLYITWWGAWISGALVWLGVTRIPDFTWASVFAWVVTVGVAGGLATMRTPA